MCYELCDPPLTLSSVPAAGHVPRGGPPKRGGEEDAGVPGGGAERRRRRPQGHPSQRPRLGAARHDRRRDDAGSRLPGAAAQGWHGAEVGPRGRPGWLVW